MPHDAAAIKKTNYGTMLYTPKYIQFIGLFLALSGAVFAQQDDNFDFGDDGGDDAFGFEESGGGSGGNVKNLDLVDTPTTETLKKGNFSFVFTGYNEGGILSRGMIGLADNFYLGVSFDIEGAIGENEPVMNVPGAIAKFRVFDGNDAFPFRTALGYDAFYAGPSGKTNDNHNPFAQALYGPYVVFSRPVYMMQREQYFNFGVRLPMQPRYRPEETSLFFGLEIPLEKAFFALVEVERLYPDSDRFDEALFNLGLRYVLFDKMALELNFMMGSGITPNRMLVFEYVDKF